MYLCKVKNWKYYLFIPLFIMFIHGVVPHSHVSSSTHFICEQENSFVHKFLDFISVDIGVNHLEDYVVQETKELISFNWFVFLFCVFAIFKIRYTKIIPFFNYHLSIPFKNQFYRAAFSHRGPPYRL